jgi:hypothetical protein|nr:MAG TPA: hypothetical protein [Caudoviricetes sp.]
MKRRNVKRKGRGRQQRRKASLLCRKHKKPSVYAACRGCVVFHSPI